MDGSPKECENANKKVVVVKCNDFFTFKKINFQKKKEKLEDLKKNLSQYDVSYITKIHKQTSASSSNFPDALQGGDASSLPNKDIAGELHGRNYMRKVLLQEGGPENMKFIGFDNLSNASKLINGTHIEKIAENTTAVTNGDLNTEIVIDLINKEYGDFLEAQIPFCQHSNGTEKSTVTSHAETALDPPKVLSDIHKYRAREEDFLEELDTEQNSNEDIDKAKEYLETIIILDSPEKDDNLFTREELKNLPQKIFESPPEPAVKHEISSLKREENLYDRHHNTDIDVQFENLKIKTKHDANTFVSSEDIVTPESSPARNDEGKIKIASTINKDVQSKKIWEMELKDINFDAFVASSNLNNGNNGSSYIGQCPKSTVDVEKNIQVGISSEDVIIFEEMDKFIEDIKVDNESLACVNLKNELLLDSTEESNKECNHINKFDITDVHNDITIISEHKNDSGKMKNVIKSNNVKENQKHEVKENKESSFLKSSVDKSDENIILLQADKKKCDILEKLVLNTEIGRNQNTTTEDVSNDCLYIQEQLMTAHKSNITTVNISEDDELEISVVVNETGESVQVTKSSITAENKLEKISKSIISDNTNCDGNKTNASGKGESKILSKDTSRTKEEVVNMNSQQNEGATTISQNAYSEITLSQCSILIVKEDGTLEPISFDDGSEPHAFCESDNQNKINDAEQGLNNRKKKDMSERINKEEILALLENAKTVQCKLINSFGDNMKLGEENLKLFSSVLKEHVKIFKDLYKKFELIIESAEEKLERDLNQEEFCDLRNNLIFMKDITEKCFVREEKKLKYKVVRITKKNDSEIKANSPKVVSKKINKRMGKLTKHSKSKLLHKTLYRMNKLLDVFEKNQKLVINARQKNSFVNKLKEMVKRDVMKNKKTSENAETGHDKEIPDTCSSQSKKLDIKNSETDEEIEFSEKTKIFASNSKSEDSSNMEKSLTIVLDRSEDTILTNKENIDENIQEIVSQRTNLHSSANSEKDVNSTFTTSISKLVEQSTNILGNETNKIRKSNDYKKYQPITKCKEETECCKIKQECSSRYSLRPRMSKSICPAFSKAMKYCKDESICESEECLGYEVDYLDVVPSKKNENRKLDYILKNDNKPCVVLYHKVQERKTSNFDNVNRPTRKQNLAKKFKGGDVKHKRVTNRYETRSKVLEKERFVEKKVLRNRNT